VNPPPQARPSSVPPQADLDAARIRKDFPILEQKVHGKRLVYLDNAATTQKPTIVLDAIRRFYENECSNVHRGLHELSAKATDEFEAARDKIQRLIGAADRREIVFTGGTTDSINLLARTFGDTNVRGGDEILISGLEHHSNIVPWQLLCERTGARLRVAPIDENGDIRMEELERLLGPRTRLVSVAYISNALGTRNPVERIIEIAHAAGVPVLLDAAQAVGHEKVDVGALDCDFMAFSGHKMHAGTGVGVLYGKAERLEPLPPYEGGGEMIHEVTFEKTTYKGLPYRFEAGTPSIAGVISLGAAVDYLEQIGPERIAAIEEDLLRYGTERLRAIPGLRIIGTAKRKSGILSFIVDGVHPHDMGTVLDLEGIAVRAGHHCAQPVMEFFKVPSTVRASFALYNTRDEVDALVSGVEKAIEVFS
jgi:cysteine desulfurase/selenocysteine lyase